MNDQNSQFENDSYRTEGGEQQYGYVFSQGEGFETRSTLKKPRRFAVGLVIAVLCICLSFGAGFGGVMLLFKKRQFPICFFSGYL